MRSSPVIRPLIVTARCKQHVILFVTPGVSHFPTPPIWIRNLERKHGFEEAGASGGHRWRLGREGRKTRGERVERGKIGVCAPLPYFQLCFSCTLHQRNAKAQSGGTVRLLNQHCAASLSITLATCPVGTFRVQKLKLLYL